MSFIRSLLVSAVLLRVDAALAVTYTLETADLPPAFSVSVEGVGDDGQVVGSYFAKSDFAEHIFTWKDGVLSVLLPAGTNSADFRAMNPEGDILGHSGGRSFLWKNGAFIDIGPAGASSVDAFFVNSGGGVAGSYVDATTFQQRPFVWTGASMVDLGPRSGRALAVDEVGRAVGELQFAAGETLHPCAWIGGVAVDLLPSGANRGSVEWVDENGFAGGRYFPLADEDSRAVVWDLAQGGVPIDLPLPAGSHLSAAMFVTYSGGFVGFFFDPDEKRHNAVWLGGAFLDISPAGGGDILGQSSDGRVVGMTDISPGIHSGYFTYDGQTYFSMLPSGAKECAVTAMNAAGQVVGAYTTTVPPDFHAALWQGDAFVDISEQLPPAVSSWAKAINAAGSVSGVYETTDGISHVFLLTPKNGQSPPTMTPIPSKPAPSLSVSGKKFTTRRKVVTLKGTVTGEVTSVIAKLNGRIFKARIASSSVAGRSNWSVKVKAPKLGRNKLILVAAGPGGTSTPGEMTIVRKKP